MSKDKYPVPDNEFERLLSLSELEIDYINIDADFKDLTKLAAKIAGTEISLINLIDSYTQWTVSSYGSEVSQVKREDSICQYTIMQDEPYEVTDMKANDLFKDEFFVKDPMSLRYYFGVPLKDKKGQNIGALCVIDTEVNELDAEKAEMLKIIAQEIVNRLSTYKTIAKLQERLKESDSSKKKVAHDIRGPLAGIIGLSRIIQEQEKSNELNEVLEFIRLIHKSSKSLLELADEILTDDKDAISLAENHFDLVLFKSKLEDLYAAQAKNKGVILEIHISEETKAIPFLKNKLLQIAGNLISNAIKFTPTGSKIVAAIHLSILENAKELSITVADSGQGVASEIIEQIFNNMSSSKDGTSGEKGYGFGLRLVRHLVLSLNGNILIANKPEEEGTIFKVTLPLSESF
jgi:signal transduction histidine kinase